MRVLGHTIESVGFTVSMDIHLKSRMFLSFETAYRIFTNYDLTPNYNKCPELEYMNVRACTIAHLHGTAVAVEGRTSGRRMTTDSDAVGLVGFPELRNSEGVVQGGPIAAVLCCLLALRSGIPLYI